MHKHYKNNNGKRVGKTSVILNKAFEQGELSEDGMTLLNSFGIIGLLLDGTTNYIDLEFDMRSDAIWATRGRFNTLTEQYMGCSGLSGKWGFGINASGKWSAFYGVSSLSSVIDADINEHVFILFGGKFYVLSSDTDISTYNSILFAISENSPTISITSAYSNVYSIALGKVNETSTYSSFTVAYTACFYNDTSTDLERKIIFDEYSDRTVKDDISLQNFTVYGDATNLVNLYGHVPIKSNTIYLDGTASGEVVFPPSVVEQTKKVYINYSTDNITFTQLVSENITETGLLFKDVANNKIYVGFDGTNYFTGWISRIVFENYNGDIFFDTYNAYNDATKDINFADQAGFEDTIFSFGNFIDTNEFYDTLQLTSLI